MRYPDESLEDALRALVFRVDQQVAPQLLVGTGQKTQKLYDVAHSFLVTSSAKKQFLGVQTTPRGNARDAEGSNASAYYFTPRTRMVTQEPKIVPRSRGRPYALPVVAAQHAYMLGDTFVVHPLSSTTPVSPILPGKHLIVVGSRVGVDRGMHLGTFDAIAVTAPNDALHTTLDFAQPDFTKFAPIYDGVCADIQCDPVWDVPTCLVAAGYVFGSTRRPLDRTAMDMRRTTGNSTDIDLSRGCAFREGTLVDETCQHTSTHSELFRGCLCRCPNGPLSPTPTLSTTVAPPLACTAPKDAHAYNFNHVSANPLTHFAATGIVCARGYVMSVGGIVVTPCDTPHTPYSVHGCVALTSVPVLEDVFSVRVSTYGAADWDCVRGETMPARSLDNWAHLGACLHDAGTGKYRTVSCVAPGTLSIQLYRDAQCRTSLEHHRITRGECTAATWWLTEDKTIPNTIWDWTGACVVSRAPHEEGECEHHVATLTYNSEDACREGCVASRSCAGYIYDRTTRTCVLYTHVARPGSRCKELPHACHATLYQRLYADAPLAVLRSNDMFNVNFRLIEKVSVRAGCKLRLIPRVILGQNASPIIYQQDADFLTDRATWPERNSIQYATVRPIYTCLGERCHSTCGTSVFWPHTAWCWIEQHAGHRTTRRWGICHCEQGQEDGTPIRGRHWSLPCVYPFIYDGHTYDGYGGNVCVESDDGLPSWCATSVYNDRSYKTYGYCDNTNPKMSACRGNRRVRRQLTSSSRRGRNKGPRRLRAHEADCVFPFRFHGRLHFACTHMFDDPNMPAWCSTKVDDDSNHVGILGNYGYCDDSCEARHLSAADDRICLQKFGPMDARWYPFGDSLYGMTSNNICPANADACRVLGPNRRVDLAEECAFGCARGECASTPCELYLCPRGTEKKTRVPSSCDAYLDRARCCCQAYTRASHTWCHRYTAILVKMYHGASGTSSGEECEESCTTLSLAAPDAGQAGGTNVRCMAFAIRLNKCYLFTPHVPRGYSAAVDAPNTCQRKICMDDDDNCKRANCGIISEAERSSCAWTCRLCDQCRDPILDPVIHFVTREREDKLVCSETCSYTLGCSHYTWATRGASGSSCQMFRDGVASDTCIHVPNPKRAMSTLNYLSDYTNDDQAWCIRNRQIASKEPIPRDYLPSVRDSCAKMCSSYGDLCMGFGEDAAHCYLYGLPASRVKETHGLRQDQPLTDVQFVPSRCFKKRKDKK